MTTARRNPDGTPKAPRFSTDDLARSRLLIRRFGRSGDGNLTDVDLDPVLAWYLTAHYGLDDDDGVVGRRGLDELFEAVAASSPSLRAYAGFHSVIGPLTRLQAPSIQDDSIRTSGFELLSRAVTDDDHRLVVFDVARLRPDDETDFFEQMEVDVDFFASMEEPPDYAAIVSREGVVVAQWGAYGEAAKTIAALDVPVAECSACVESEGPHLITVIRRRFTGIDVQKLIDAGVPIVDEASFFERMMLVMDPRCWSVATGNAPTGVQQQGWLASRPLLDFTQAQPLEHFDSVNGDPAGFAEAPGASWNADDFYELVWPGFNKPYGVVLRVQYLANIDAFEAFTGTDLPTGDHLTVLYRINEQIVEPGSGLFDDRPVGPNVMPLRLDDGFLTMFKEGGTWTVEMYKELDFVDIAAGMAFDAIEELMPFVACPWFDIMQLQWWDYAKDPTKGTPDIRAEVQAKQADLAGIPAPY